MLQRWTYRLIIRWSRFEPPVVEVHDESPGPTILPGGTDSWCSRSHLQCGRRRWVVTIVVVVVTTVEVDSLTVAFLLLP